MLTERRKFLYLEERGTDTDQGRTKAYTYKAKSESQISSASTAIATKRYNRTAAFGRSKCTSHTYPAWSRRDLKEGFPVSGADVNEIDFVHSIFLAAFNSF